MPRHREFELNAKKQRSSVSNGRFLFNHLDHRSAWMRRYRDLILLHESDLGGEANLLESERRLVRRAATITIELELMERQFAEDQKLADRALLETFQRMTNTLRRTLESLGLRRRPKDISPKSLDEYLRDRAEAAE
jgi:hypothetical protein